MAREHVVVTIRLGITVLRRCVARMPGRLTLGEGTSHPVDVVLPRAMLGVDHITLVSATRDRVTVAVPPSMEAVGCVARGDAYRAAPHRTLELGVGERIVIRGERLSLTIRREPRVGVFPRGSLPRWEWRGALALLGSCVLAGGIILTAWLSTPPLTQTGEPRIERLRALTLQPMELVREPGMATRTGDGAEPVFAQIQLSPERLGPRARRDLCEDPLPPCPPGIRADTLAGVSPAGNEADDRVAFRGRLERVKGPHDFTLVLTSHSRPRRAERLRQGGFLELWPEGEHVAVLDFPRDDQDFPGPDPCPALRSGTLVVASGLRWGEHGGLRDAQICAVPEGSDTRGAQRAPPRAEAHGGETSFMEPGT